MVLIYYKVRIMNKVADFSRSLGVECRCSLHGISILGDTPKFFSIDSLYLDKGKACKKHIKEVADPSLQTHFL